VFDEKLKSRIDAFILLRHRSVTEGILKRRRDIVKPAVQSKKKYF
jgi:hypothetical protein